MRGVDVDGEEHRPPYPDQPSRPPGHGTGSGPVGQDDSGPAEIELRISESAEPDAEPDAVPDTGSDADSDAPDPDPGDLDALDSGLEHEAAALVSPLPEAVRQRVVALASEAAGQLPLSQLPGSLRPFARFTAIKRARLAATPLAAAVATDAGFRGRLADRLREAFPDLVDAVSAGRFPAAADPRDLGAVAYLVRPEGWTRMVDDAAHMVRSTERAIADEHLGNEVARLKAEIDALRETSRNEVERLKDELAGTRKEGDSLRRQIRRLEADMRRAQAAARQAEAGAQLVREEAAAVVSQAEKELRKARAKVADAENALEAGRRAARGSRAADDIRLRLLLETISEAATGLRRELALSPTDQRPADSVDAVRPAEPGTGDIAASARQADDPAILDALLALPRAHLVIDGYNVTKTGYPTLSLHEQRVRLLRGLGSLAARTGAEVTCVFDGAQLGGPVPVPQPKGVRVLFSKPGEIADELIRRLVAAEPPGRPLIVVSSDREVADGVRRSGARPVPSAMLVRALARA
jgi:predicted RNA-binding protein with PIN domain